MEQGLVYHPAEEEADKGKHYRSPRCQEYPLQARLLPAYLLVEIGKIDSVKCGEHEGIEEEESQELRIEQRSNFEIAEDQVDEDDNDPDEHGYL